jgi:hypothetical protein
MEQMEEIGRGIFEKMRRRLMEETRRCMDEKGDTERFDRVLALWIDVQRAIHLRERHDTRPNGCTPWNCPDKRVRAAWKALTNPKNVLALESLYYQLPEGTQMEMARKALQICRERRTGK